MADHADGIPPQEIDYEHAVIGALLQDNSQYPSVRRRVTPEMFYRHECRSIYDTLCRIMDTGAPADILTITTICAGDDWDEQVRVRMTLAAAIESCASPRNAWYYADRIRSAYIERRAASLCMKAAERLVARDDPAKVLSVLHEQAGALKAALAGDEAGPTTTDLLNEILDELDGSQVSKRVPCGIPGIGQLIRGWAQGELVVVGAATSVGKTSLCVQIMRVAASAGRSVLYVSTEMPPKQIMQRLLSQVAGVSYAATEGAASIADARAVGDAAQQIAQWPMTVIHPTSRHVATVAAAIEKAKPEIAIVDYLQLLQGDGDNRTQQIGDAVAQLKQAALNVPCPVIVASQVSRAAMQESGGRPRLHHLRESGEIENHADIVIMLWRDRDEKFINGHAVRHIAVEKHRNGPTGTAPVSFNGVCARWDNLIGEIE